MRAGHNYRSNTLTPQEGFCHHPQRLGLRIYRYLAAFHEKASQQGFHHETAPLNCISPAFLNLSWQMRADCLSGGSPHRAHIHHLFEII